MRDLFPKNVKCKSCANLSEHWCDQVDDSPDEEILRDCQYFRQMTNADRIRAMSDEELAAFLCDRCEHCTIRRCPAAGLCENGKGKANGLVKWLQQPAEEE